MTSLANEVDITDLELLDDEYEHCICLGCHPAPHRWGDVYPSVCGKPQVILDDVADLDAPDRACPDCLLLYRLPCLKCAEAMNRG